MKKKILIISAVFPPEQVTSAFLNYDLAKALAKDYKVTVLRPKPTRPIGIKFDYVGMGDEPFETVLINSYTHPQSQLLGRFKESIDFGIKCANYIRAHHDEIAFVYNNPWQLFGVNIVARTANKYHIPYMIAVQDIYPESLLTNKHYPKVIEKIINFFLLPIDRYYQKNAYRVRTISDEMADYLSTTRNVPREKYLVLDNWQDDESFMYTPLSFGEKLVFGYVGSVNSHSNTDLIIKAFHEANIPNSELRIYGGGNRKEMCIQLTKKLKMDNVFFDVVDKNEVPKVQGESHVLVLALPKGNGGLCLPSKMTSYMLSGRPILASVDLDSTTSRYIGKANCGKVTEPDDIMALADGYRYYASLSEDNMVKMGENSRHFAEENLSKKVNLKKVVDAIEDYFAVTR